jgi:hypothetical protein
MDPAIRSAMTEQKVGSVIITTVVEIKAIEGSVNYYEGGSPEERTWIYNLTNPWYEKPRS